jgi:hypothetical protein
LRLPWRNEGLMPEVMCKREGLDELFEAAHGRLIAISVDGLQVWRNGSQKLGDIGKSCIYVFLDIGRKLLV